MLDNDRMFICIRIPGNLKLSPESCAASYRRGKRAQPWESSCACRGCPVGAAHAGEELPAITDDMKVRCRLCQSTQARKTVYGSVCISCYNRLLEAFRDSNARGRKPCKLVGSCVSDGIAVTRAGVTFMSHQGRLAWFGRAVGKLPTPQLSIFEV